MEDGEFMEATMIRCPECGAEFYPDEEEPEVSRRGDLDFYDGVEEKEERERMEDRGEMEHPPY